MTAREIFIRDNKQLKEKEKKREKDKTFFYDTDIYYMYIQDVR